MRSAKEVSEQYCPNGVILEDDQYTICKQYAKEAIQEVLKKYWEHNSKVLRSGGKMETVDNIALKVIKNLINEANIEVSQDSLKIVMMDPANIAMVIFTLQSSAAVEWKIPKDFLMAVNISNFYRILKNAKSSDLITLSNGEKDKLKITLAGKTRGSC